MIFLLVCLVSPTLGQTTRTVVLISIGPGDEIYEKFGHNLLWIRDSERNIDLCYNWGLFDFSEDNFVWNFVQGRLNYAMGAAGPTESLGEYYDSNRHVVFQRLALTTEQINDLIDRCEQNRRPENRKYRYDYFQDNCATRIRDMIDATTGGQLKRLIDQQTPQTAMSYRQHSMRLTHDDFFLSLGLDFVYGPSCDRPLTAWEECFLPMRLLRYMEPLSIETWNPWTSNRPPEQETVPDRRLVLAAVGIIISAIMLLLAYPRQNRIARFISVALLAGWWMVCGFGGWLLLYMWFFTDHVATYANHNLLTYSPLAWIGVVALAAGRRRVRYRRVTYFIAGIILIVGVAALLLHGSLLRQHNLHFLFLAIPLHAASFLVVRRLTAESRVGELPAV